MAEPQTLRRLEPTLVKHREVLFQEVHADREQARTAAGMLRTVSGVLDVTAPTSTRLDLTYDLRQVCLRDIECALEEVGFHLDNSLLSKLRRSVWYYTEDTQRANLGCDNPRNCARRIFVDAYRHHAHGCRDERPEHLRLYW